MVVAATVVALISARDYAGGWNDGSRLATVESVVDRHTLIIDDSIFVRSPDRTDVPSPYAPGDELLHAHGTQDKLLIGGHYYSDKSPLPALWLSACYQVLQWSSGLTAREHPRLFCYLMTILSSGVAYVLTTWSTFRLAWRKGLSPAVCLLLAASISLATTAAAYTRHVNNHILLLGVISLLMLALDRIVRGGPTGLPVITSGALAGLGYTLDLGVGPVLLVCTTVLVAFRTRSLPRVATFALAAVPCLAAHHAMNYLTGGTLGPANSVPEYLAWPGSPFSTANMTGGWAHGTVGHFVLYAAALVFGKHGFLNYNLPLMLAIAGFAALLRRRVAELPEVVFAAALSAGAWLLYAALSNNYSGPCCSIRWFVPLLAPAYYVLIILLRERPVLVRDVIVLTLAGALMCTVLWWRGPWDGRVPLLLWPLNVVSLIGWGLSRLRFSIPVTANQPDVALALDTMQKGQ